MGWAKFSDDTHCNDHVLGMPPAARWLWAASIMDNRGYKAGRDSHISQTRARALVRQQGLTWRTAEHVIAAGRWEAAGDGYDIHDYLDFLPETEFTSDSARKAGLRSAELRRERFGTALPTNAPNAPSGSRSAKRNQRPVRDAVRPNGPNPARVDPVPVPVPVGEQRDKELSLVVQRHSSAANGGPLLLTARQRVFAAWQAVTGKLRARLDSKRSALIDRALKSYPEGELLDAVRGWRHSAHHRGENDSQTTYNDIELILRDAKHIEFFRDLERDGGDVSLFERAARELEAHGQ